MSDQHSSEGNVDGEDPNGQLNGADDADLFGSESENEGTGDKQRFIDDEELDSGDDEGRNDREELSDPEEAIHTREENVLDIDIGRHAIPHPSDGELYLLQFPPYLGIEPKAFTTNDWKPPTSEHHTNAAPSSNFSAYNTSNNTIRWRRSPRNSQEIQSNARVLRWSDGSLTLQVASNPREQFALSGKPLAPPQVNPIKPTPTSIKGIQAPGKPAYDARLDTHTYLASPHEAVSLLQITNHVTASLAVQSYADQDDDALIKLQETLAAATKGPNGTDGGVGIMHITEDPELAKKKAEVAEKEKARATRRRQLQEEKERERSARVLGRSGLRTGGYGGGLTIGGLEDDDGTARPRARPSKPKTKKPRRRNSEYSDEEEFMTRGRTKEDEYDEDDGFLVGSDEEEELVDDASEEEEDIDMEDEKPSKKNSNRDAKDAALPGSAGSPRSRTKRRRVIDEEDEDE